MGDCYGGVVGWPTELGQAPVNVAVSGQLGKLGTQVDTQGGGTQGQKGQSIYPSAFKSCMSKPGGLPRAGGHGTDQFSSVLAPSFHLIISTSNGRVPIPKASARGMTSLVWRCIALSGPGPSMLANYPAPYTSGPIRPRRVSAYTQNREYIRVTICVRAPIQDKASIHAPRSFIFSGWLIMVRLHKNQHSLL